MELLTRLLQQPKKRLMIIFLVVSIFFLIIIRILSFLNPSSLTPVERTYPTVQPEVFDSSSREKKTVVITSEPSGARVVIDPPEEEAGDDSKPATVVETPFTTQLTTGPHIITAFKKDYQEYSEQVVITNTTTRVKITLVSEFSEGYQTETHFHYGQWIDSLPLKHPEYYVEYDRNTATIKARLYPPPSFSIPQDEYVEDLKKEVQKKLQEIGADVSKETIEWIIES